MRQYLRQLNVTIYYCYKSNGFGIRCTFIVVGKGIYSDPIGAALWKIMN